MLPQGGVGAGADEVGGLDQFLSVGRSPARDLGLDGDGRVPR
jgi:hypothetical protein